MLQTKCVFLPFRCSSHGILKACQHDPQENLILVAYYKTTTTSGGHGGGGHTHTETHTQTVGRACAKKSFFTCYIFP
jgi:hypothetical protein